MSFKSFAKKSIRNLPFSSLLLDRRGPKMDTLEEWVAMGRPLLPPELALKAWEAAGRPMPPPHAVKQRALRECARRHGLRIFVETGTYYGDMLAALKDDFDLLYSVELGGKLYRRAKRRFRGLDRIRLLRGDSGKKLARILEEIDGPALFWLDGHFSAGSTAKGDIDTPIMAELRLILQDRNRRHAIVIDDARCFGTDPSYPTLESLKDFVLSLRKDLEIAVQDDSIRITPA